MKKVLILVVSTAIVSFTSYASMAKEGKSRVVPAGYENVSSACWPDGKQHNTKSCCEKTILSRGGLKSYAVSWCFRNGYTK